MPMKETLSESGSNWLLTHKSFPVILFVPTKVKSMQRPGTEAIITQIQPSKTKREITKITHSQNTKEKIWSTE